MVNIVLLVIGQKAKNSDCEWFIQLSDNSILLLDTPINTFAVRLRKNLVLNEQSDLRKL